MGKGSDTQLVNNLPLIIALSTKEALLVTHLIGELNRMSQKRETSKMTNEELRNLNNTLDLGVSILTKITSAQKASIQMLDQG